MTAFIKARQMGFSDSNISQWLTARARLALYDGEGDATVVGATGDDALPEEMKGKTTFTQEELNKILAVDRRKHNEKFEAQKKETEKQIKSLEVLQKSKSLSEEDKNKLAEQVDELKKGLLTKEQLAAQEKKKLEDRHGETVKTLTGERDTWQQRFHRQTINNAILSAASQADAFDAEDLIARLSPDTRLVQEMDSDNNPTENFVPKVKFTDVDKDNKPVVVDFTVDQAVTRMKEMPRFKHLFKTPATGGIGAAGGSGKGKGGSKEVKDMTTEEYRKHRTTMGLGRQPGQ